MMNSCSTWTGYTTSSSGTGSNRSTSSHYVSKSLTETLLRRDDFSLNFLESKAIVTSGGFSDGTLAELWKRASETPGLHISAKNIKVRKLELLATINYPPKQQVSTHDEDEDNEVSVFIWLYSLTDLDLVFCQIYTTTSSRYHTRAKRKASSTLNDDSAQPARKRA